MRRDRAHRGDYANNLELRKMNNYRSKTLAELAYILKDASDAAKAMQSIGNAAAECKYLDQVNDACTELNRRGRK